MRIGIDCRTVLSPAVGGRAEVGHYTYHLVKALLEQDDINQYVLFFDYRMAAEGTQEFQRPNVKIRFFPFSSYGRFLPIAYSQMLVSAVLLRARLDLFHAPANIIPLGYRRPSVVTVHNLVSYKYPEWFPTQVFSTRVLVPRSLRRAKRVIAVSESTKRDIREQFDVPVEKIVVIPEAADVAILPLEDADDDVRKVYHLPERFVLFVGTIEPRRNIRTLLEAWRDLWHHQTELGDVKLVLAGSLGRRGKRQLRAIRELRLEGAVRFLGSVTRNHKVKLIEEAMAFVYPSLYEGFGLPILEAMSLGTPVISSTSSSLPEVAADAALLFEPTDVQGLARAMHRLLTNPKFAAELAQRGRRRARHFSWMATAKQTLRVYEDIIARLRA
ncbi:MAG: glycosyltransferase family 4 protein [Candidatus Kerfeldbacteria bacterium]|nr:glycosyltransferase family 4 protein [Candidatus Kerfeldbacteria bacterium]